MTNKLWEKKGWAKLDENLENFKIGSVVNHPDNALLEADVMGSLAHAKMLNKIGVLTVSELKKLNEGLLKIIDLKQKGEFNLELDDEDIHTKIENFLTKNYGLAGKKLHTARSRNDQVLTATRIYTKQELCKVIDLVLGLCQTLTVFSQKYEFVPMPGYTHMQKAMPSSVGLWSSSFVESLLDDLKSLGNAYELNDQSPLGSAASYGVSLPIDRQLTSDLLGFSKVQNNVLYCQNSRGKFEASVIFAYCQIAETLSKLAMDILLFNTAEFGFIKVGSNAVTGSSIMPQKKNADVVELVRAEAHSLYSYLNQCLGVISGLPSGYNTDTKKTKGLLILSTNLVKSVLETCDVVIQGLEINKEKMLAALTPEIFATDYAFELVLKKNLPFREAYKIVGENLETLPHYDPVKNIKAKTHVGATGNLGLLKLSKQITIQKELWDKKQTKFKNKLNNLL